MSKFSLPFYTLKLAIILYDLHQDANFKHVVASIKIIHDLLDECSKPECNKDDCLITPKEMELYKIASDIVDNHCNYLLEKEKMVKKHIGSLDDLLITLKKLIQDHNVDEFCNLEELIDTVWKINYTMKNSEIDLLPDQQELFDEADAILEHARDKEYIR